PLLSDRPPLARRLRPGGLAPLPPAWQQHARQRRQDGARYVPRILQGVPRARRRPPETETLQLWQPPYRARRILFLDRALHGLRASRGDELGTDAGKRRPFPRLPGPAISAPRGRFWGPVRIGAIGTWTH